MTFDGAKPKYGLYASACDLQVNQKLQRLAKKNAHCYTFQIPKLISVKKKKVNLSNFFSFPVIGRNVSDKTIRILLYTIYGFYHLLCASLRYNETDDEYKSFNAKFYAIICNEVLSMNRLANLNFKNLSIYSIYTLILVLCIRIYSSRYNRRNLCGTKLT